MSALSDFLTQGASPWWAPIATGFGGIGLTSWLNTRRENSKADRELSLRWDTSLREISARFITAVWDVQQVYEQQWQFAEHRDAGALRTQVLVDVGVIKERRLKAHMMFGELVLVAPDPMAYFANEFLLSAFIEEGRSLTDENYQTEYKTRFTAAYGNFVASSRYHLGVDKELPGTPRAR